MVPRPYNATERQRTVDAGRERMLSAARELLEDVEGEPFSIDAVARRAGVARMTVYNQFESKAGLLEELFDSIAMNGAFGQMDQVFRQTDPLAAMDAFVGLFGRFWTDVRVLHGRLRAAALFDEELGAAMAARNERRRFALAELVKRVSSAHRLPLSKDETVNSIFVLLSYDGFNEMAGVNKTPLQIVPTMRRLVRQILGAD